MEQTISERIVAYLAEHPNRGAKRIAGDIGADKAAVEDDLVRLRASGRVVSKGAGFVVSDAAATVEPVDEQHDADELAAATVDTPAALETPGPVVEPAPQSEPPEATPTAHEPVDEPEPESADPCEPEPPKWREKHDALAEIDRTEFVVKARWLKNQLGRGVRQTGRINGRDLRRGGYRIAQLLAREWIEEAPAEQSAEDAEV